MTTIIDPTGELQALVRRAQAGDKAVLAELRRFLDHHPDVWAKLGDLAQLAENAWLGLIAGGDLVLQESVKRKIDALRGDLAGPAPSPLESLLVDRVVLGWLVVHFADAAYGGLKDAEASTPALRKEMMARMEMAQRRFLAAIRQLATVRKLLGSARPAPSRAVAWPGPERRAVGD